MKKILLGLALLFMGFIAYSQGLEGLSVEKYYTANAADATEFGMPTGTVIWRFYVDLEPGYELNSVFGDENHELYIETYTSGGKFWNSSFAAGVYKGEGIVFNTALAGVPGYYGLFLDSWIAFSKATNDKEGVLKPEDTDGSILTGQFNTPALDATDGMIAARSLPAMTDLGIDASAISQLSASGLSTGNRFATSTGAWNILGGIQGPTTDNKVLIAQIASTDGNLKYEFALTLNDPSGALVIYVASNPQAGENEFAQLAGTTFVPNQAPTAAITAPAPGTVYTTGDIVNITATGNDPDGSVASMHFWVDGVIDLGIDNTPGDGFTRTWTSTVGSHQLTAIATDNEGLEGSASPSVQIQVNDPNLPPTVSITQPTDGQVIYLDISGGTLTGVPVVINATYNDPDGSVTDVDLLIDGIAASGFSTFPYTWNSYSSPADVDIRVIVTDNAGAMNDDEITIELKDPSTVYKLGSLNVPCSSPNVFCLDVISVQPIANVTGFDLELTFESDYLVPTGRVTVYPGFGVHPDSAGFAMNIETDRLYLSVFLTGLQDNVYWTKGTGEAAIICVEFARTTAFAANFTQTVNCPFMQESYERSVSDNLPTESGEIGTYQDTQYMGKLVFWADNQPIKGDPGTTYEETFIRPCVGSGYQVEPNDQGIFYFNVLESTEIKIIRDIPGSRNVMPVINGMDAQITARLVTNDYTPTVLRLIAMDVNMDGVVSAGDISQINQRTVFIADEFKQAWNISNGQPSKDWLWFDNTSLLNDLKYRISATFPLDDGEGYSKYNVPTQQPDFCFTIPVFDAAGNPLSVIGAMDCPIFEPETWVGVLLGDVNGNWKNLPAGSALKSASDYVLFDMANARTQGNTIDVPVSVSSANNVFALDFGLKYNEQNLELKSVIDYTGKLEMMSHYRLADQTFRFTSYSMLLKVLFWPFVSSL
jgi:hypothetical protein